MILMPLTFSPGNFRRCLDDLIWQLGGDVAQAADDGLTCKGQRALGVPALLPESQARPPHQLPRPDLLEGHRLPWSQIHGLGADVLVPRLEGAPRDDVNPNSEEFLKILEQADVTLRSPSTTVTSSTASRRGCWTCIIAGLRSTASCSSYAQTPAGCPSAPPAKKDSAHCRLGVRRDEEMPSPEASEQTSTRAWPGQRVTWPSERMTSQVS